MYPELDIYPNSLGHQRRFYSEKYIPNSYDIILVMSQFLLRFKIRHGTINKQVTFNEKTKAISYLH